MKRLRLYLDTSVFGGCLDPEFSKDSRRVVQMADLKKATFLITEALLDEMKTAPPQVREVLERLPKDMLEMVSLNGEVYALAKAYLDAEIVTDKSIIDAIHVSAATVAKADAIVSWNFKHIVQFGRMRRYNEVNLANGYGFLAIVSPGEIRDEK